VEQLLEKMSPESRPVAAACFWGALRISEALALKWVDVDFDNNCVRVAGTKTEASAGTIPLLPALARELRDLQRRKRAQGIHLVASDARVFSTGSGKPVSRRNVLRAVQRAARRAGLQPEGAQPVGNHDLRHSLASNAFALGLAPTEVAALLRHANPKV